jgi:hypothetical protein
MPTFTFTVDYSTEAERLALEQTAAYLADLRRASAEAPAGTVLDACEQVVLGAGRAALRSTLQAALQSRAQLADAASKKSPARGRKAPVPAGF